MGSQRRIRVLVVGESWMRLGLHAKGFVVYSTASYDEGGKPLLDALAPVAELTYLRNHEATSTFPQTSDDLSRYDVVILSDCPSDTLLLSPAVTQRSESQPNRLIAIKEYVANGGGFLMVGGYMSFAGFNGQAKYYASPVEEVLPVKIARWDDRIECPQGVIPLQRDVAHPVLEGIANPWPSFLGYNQFIAKSTGEVLITVEEDPFLVVGNYGKGRTAAFASDCSPHWAPPGALAWTTYGRFWQQLALWLAG